MLPDSKEVCLKMISDILGKIACDKFHSTGVDGGEPSSELKQDVRGEFVAMV